jgi:hypothetical protein
MCDRAEDLLFDAKNPTCEVLARGQMVPGGHSVQRLRAAPAMIQTQVSSVPSG